MSVDINSDWDKLLNIQTTDIIDWNTHALDYYRSEPTEYYVLDYLAQQITLEDNDVIVDFGAGTGRVVFYLNNFYNLPVKGIEYHPYTFKLLERNLMNYSKIFRGRDINLYNQRAEDYLIDQHDTIFYFFNPFSLQVFKRVISKIIQSMELYQRRIILICYYPSHYIDYIKYSTPFKETMRLVIPSGDATDYAMIYEWRGESIDSNN